MWKKGIIASLVLVSLGMFYFGPVPQLANKKTIPDEPSNNVYEPIVVLELFTSQGCSSCPAADALLQNLGDGSYGNIFALSYHIDYWNYIGWKDPFSKGEYADKQREYNIKFKNRSNYTPQMVVNGREHFVGSSSSKMYDAIERYGKKKSANEIGISNIAVNKNSVGFDYSVSGDLNDKRLRAVLVLGERTTEVKRGENKNRTFTNSNIVVAEKNIVVGDRNDSAFIGIPEIVNPTEKILLFLLLETDDYDITAAAKSQVSR